MKTKYLSKFNSIQQLEMFVEHAMNALQPHQGHGVWSESQPQLLGGEKSRWDAIGRRVFSSRCYGVYSVMLWSCGDAVLWVGHAFEVNFLVYLWAQAASSFWRDF